MNIFNRIREKFEERKALWSEEQCQDRISAQKHINTWNAALAIVDKVEKDYNNGWIPCSKELPKNITTDCLVTLKNGAVVQASYSYFGEEFRMICMHGIERFSDDNPVIAWQPTPEGYQESEE